MARMGRSPSTYVTVTKRGLLLIGSEVYEQAGRPMYLRPEWDGSTITLWVSEAPEKRRQGIVKVIANNASSAISVKPLIEEVGLVEGRYRPTHVDAVKITFGTEPFWTPEATEGATDGASDRV